MKNYHLPRINQTHSYKNPVLYSNMDTIPMNPDPYILKYNGYYYCYSTDEEGVNISISQDLCTWKFLNKTAKEQNKHDYWAPCVIYDNGSFYMYCSNTGTDTKDNHQEYLQLYVSEHPHGPFSYVKTFFQKFSIDAHVVKDLDGLVYIFYSVNDYMGTDEHHPGTVILVDRLINYTELAGEEHPVVLPSIDEEIFEENRFGDNRDWYTIEGACFLRHHQRSYLIYAANAYIRENYFLGYSQSKDNGSISNLSWDKYPSNECFSPLVFRNSKVEGTGHCSVVKAPNLIDDWLIYHGRNLEIPINPSLEQRVMRIDPLFYSGARLFTNAPSYLEQDAPSLPAYSSYDTLSDALFDTIECNGVSRQVFKHVFKNYVMEWDLSSRPSHLGSRYGIILSYDENENYIELIIDSGKRCVSIVYETNKFSREIETYKLPLDFRHDKSHNIRIHKNFSSFDVFLDGILIFQFYLEFPCGHVGTVTRYSNICIHYFAITEHTELYNKHLFLFQKLFKSSSPIIFENNRLKCVSKNIATIEELIPTHNMSKTIECLMHSTCSFLCAEIIENDHSVCIFEYKNGVCIFVTSQDSSVEKWEYHETHFSFQIKQFERRTGFYFENKFFCLENESLEKQLLRLNVLNIDILSYETTQL